MNVSFWETSVRNNLTEDSFEISWADKGNNETLVIPDGTAGILKILDGEFTRTSRGRNTSFKKGDLILFGQKTHAVEYKLNTNDFRAVGVKMSPQIIFKHYNLHAQDITDDFVHLEQLHKPPSDHQMLSKDIKSEQLVHTITLMINQSKGSLRISSICKELNVSYKTMQRLFAKYIGLSPKHYARIVRFNHSIAEALNPQNNLTHTAFECGYYDQNHFIKEFKNFTDKTPTQVLTDTHDSHLLHYLRNKLSGPVYSSTHLLK